MEKIDFEPDLSVKNYLETRSNAQVVKSYESRVKKELATLAKEVVQLRGASGKPVKMTMGELSTKKINGKVEVVGNTYHVRLTRWYELDKTYTNLNEATNALVKIVQKIDRLRGKLK